MGGRGVVFSIARRPPPFFSLFQPKRTMTGCRNDQYQYLEMIGEGTYSKVYKGRNRETHEVIALKKMQLNGSSEGIPTVATREIALLRELNHRNIIQLKVFHFFVFCFWRRRRRRKEARREAGRERKW